MKHSSSLPSLPAAVISQTPNTLTPSSSHLKQPISQQVPPYTLLLSLITRPTHPSPATSTTFSCQLSSTLIAAPTDSPPAVPRPPTAAPVDCGVNDARAWCVAGCAMPLYLRGVSRLTSHSRGEDDRKEGPLTGTSSACRARRTRPRCRTRAAASASCPTP